ncbi:GntR family transcriptional regulator [Leucobacter sp. HNU]|uniref:GntR family transcriptional regulator n=1 Tax=Leucobacter sp. HNU TaxID=3236805 RepID=UPI003A7F71BF
MPIPKKPDAVQQQRPLLRDVAAERIRAAIMDGTLQPGEPLNDKELQEWLGVSRTPIRDALNELTRSGLVEMEPNRYTRVALLREEETLEAMQALGVLLGGVVRLALPRMTEESRMGVLRELEQAGLDLIASDFAAARDRVFAIWEGLAAETGNGQLQRMYRDAVYGLFYKIPPQFFVKLYDAEAMRQQLAKLVVAVRDGDAIAAELATEALYQLPGE